VLEIFLDTVNATTVNLLQKNVDNSNAPPFLSSGHPVCRLLHLLQPKTDGKGKVQRTQLNSEYLAADYDFNEGTNLPGHNKLPSAALFDELVSFIVRYIYILFTYLTRVYYHIIFADAFDWNSGTAQICRLDIKRG
jgi:hypothetical protein